MTESELPAHVKIFSNIMTLFGVALLSPFSLMFQGWLNAEEKWSLSFLLAGLGISIILINIIHARWYIGKKEKLKCHKNSI